MCADGKRGLCAVRRAGVEKQRIMPRPLLAPAGPGAGAERQGGVPRLLPLGDSTPAGRSWSGSREAGGHSQATAAARPQQAQEQRGRGRAQDTTLAGMTLCLSCRGNIFPTAH